jgi:hypothetical protein
VREQRLPRMNLQRWKEARASERERSRRAYRSRSNPARRRLRREVSKRHGHEAPSGDPQCVEGTLDGEPGRRECTQRMRRESARLATFPSCVSLRVRLTGLALSCEGPPRFLSSRPRPATSFRSLPRGRGPRTRPLRRSACGPSSAAAASWAALLAGCVRLAGESPTL